MLLFPLMMFMSKAWIDGSLANIEKYLNPMHYGANEYFVMVQPSAICTITYFRWYWLNSPWTVLIESLIKDEKLGKVQISAYLKGLKAHQPYKWRCIWRNWTCTEKSRTIWFVTSDCKANSRGKKLLNNCASNVMQVPPINRVVYRNLSTT